MWNRGTVAKGRIEQGVIKVGEEVEILGLKDVSVYEYCIYSAKVVITVKHFLDLISRDLQ